MLKREKYIQQIITSLSQFQTEVKLNNTVKLLNINHTAEDFMCGLLNLVYGWRLKNKNHKQQDAVAVDLVDKQNRLAVQVTSDTDRRKIQYTIDKFLLYGLDQEYDHLYILLLKDDSTYKKPFDTKGFPFDHRKNILHIADLIREIDTLEIERLCKINEYLNDEFCGRLYQKQTLNESTSEVYLSILQPYTKAGFYASPDGIPLSDRTEIETEKAFSILSFVRSNGKQNSIIENQYCRILDLKPIEEPALILYAVIVADTLRFFAFNDGWGTAEALSIESLSFEMMGRQGSLDIIIDEAHIAEGLDVAPAGGKLLAEYTLNRLKFLQYLTFPGSDLHTNISLKVQGENCFAEWHSVLSLSSDGFHLIYKWGGNFNTYNITLFAVLDVDSRPSIISFTGPDATPRVNDILRVETVLAPTKSCVLTCKNVFLVDGKKQETKIYTVTVTVPAFMDDFKNGLKYGSGLLDAELGLLDRFDMVSMNQILQEYRYNPETIRNHYIER